MPFIPHTEDDLASMLKAIDAKSIEDLFDEIPPELRIAGLQNVPEGMSEMDVARLMGKRAAQNKNGLCFIGAGAYEHHIPAVIGDMISRGEFLTSYTPYQAEASQGTLQLLYEYQTMMAHLTGMEVSNASLYDGASALAEAVLMAIRCFKNTKINRILIPESLHPAYAQTVKTISTYQHIQWEKIPYCPSHGNIKMDTLKPFGDQEVTALIIQQPNFFGVLEDVDELTNWAHERNILVIAIVNPLALGLLKEPGSWGERGADIVCGEAQPLGIPLASGGPYLGFLCSRRQFIRQMPGRIVGRSVDQEGKTAFTLTLQAREQHIRRAKATSNICTNQNLLAIVATLYMSLLGAEGLRRVAASCHQQAVLLKEKLTAISGVSSVFKHPFFNEFVLRVNEDVPELLKKLAQVGIQGGLDLGRYYPELTGCLLVCATETKTEEDLNIYQQQLLFLLERVKSHANL